jgi:hypothetical protein
VAQVLAKWRAKAACDLSNTPSRVIPKGSAVEATRLMPEYRTGLEGERWLIRPVGSDWSDGDRLVARASDLHSMELVLA